jgi:sulfofructose kinase
VRFDVVGLGLSSVDHLAVVERLPRLDSKQPIRAYDLQPGGQVPTALVALQRWGMRTANVGAVGDDAGGRLVRRSLAAEGVDVSATLVRAATRHPVSLLLVDRCSGERSVLSEPADRLHLRREEILDDVCFAGRVLLTDAVPLSTVVGVAREARARGAWVVLDVDEPQPGLDDLLQATDVLIASAGFVQRLTGCGDVERAVRAAARRGPWFVAATLGPGGAAAVVRGRAYYVPAFPVRPVDTTAAGDLFHAGAIYGLLQGWPVTRVLRFAAAAGALEWERIGGRPGIPTLEQVQTLAGRGATR